MSIKVFIQGSCVTRDAFAFSKTKDFLITHYSARCSLATLASPPIKQKLELSQLNSNFQKKMLEDDHNRSVLKHLDNKEYNIVILDFIDERGGLISLDNLGYVTNLSELKNSGVISTASSIENIQPYSENHINLFFTGLENFIKKIKTPSIILINEVYWAIKNEKNELITTKIKYINETNTNLKKIYQKIKNIYPQFIFINYDESLFIANSQHKWGQSPFHYIDDLYLSFLEKIKDKILDKIETIDISLKSIGDTIYCTTIINAPFELEYAIYIFKENKKIDQILYQTQPFFKIRHFGSGHYKIRLFSKIKGTNIKKIEFSSSVYLDI